MKSPLVRRLDNLGRVVIPKEIRRTLNLADDEALEISYQGNRITLTPHRAICIICGQTSEDKLTHVRDAAICSDCLVLAAK